MAITFVRFKLIIVAVFSLATCHFAHGLVLPVDHSNTFRHAAKLLDSPIHPKAQEIILFDFTAADADVSGWIEESDTIREAGMSKGIITIQKAQLFQRAIFFALLNPQPNGAGFAGVRQPVVLDLSRFSSIKINLRGQGLTTGFKVALKHHNEVGDGTPSYEQFFIAPRDFQTVTLPLEEFKPYSRGTPLNDTVDPLDITDITSFGLQYYGGVYEVEDQFGPATFEIDWIKAYSD